MGQTYHGSGSGRKGLMVVTTCYATCLCGVTELRTHSLTSSVAQLEEEGWTNGHPLELAPMPGAQGIETEWRCPECEVPCPRCRPDLKGEIYARRAKIGQVCEGCEDEMRTIEETENQETIKLGVYRD